MNYFVTALHTLAEHCDYGPLSEQMIIDRLVVRLLNANLWERLQLEANLKLADAIPRAHNTASVKSQQSTVRGHDTSLPTHSAVTVDAISIRSHHQFSNKQPHHRTCASAFGTVCSTQQPSPSQPSPSSHKCGWCGKAQHSCERCPARNVKCRQCGKVEHYAAVCRSMNSRRRLHEYCTGRSILGSQDKKCIAPAFLVRMYIVD